MDPITIVGVITAGIPFVTAFVKKIFNTDKLPESPRKGINTLIPIILGIVSSGLYAYSSQGMDVYAAIAIGLGSGGVASSARDIEKNLIKLVGAITNLIKKK